MKKKKSLRIFGKGRWWHRPLAHPTHCPGQKPKPNPIDSRKGVHTQHCLICDVVSVLFHFANTYHQQKGVKGVANLWGIFWARPAKTNMTFHLPRSSFSTASPSSCFFKDLKIISTFVTNKLSWNTLACATYFFQIHATLAECWRKTLLVDPMFLVSPLL